MLFKSSAKVHGVLPKQHQGQILILTLTLSKWARKAMASS